MPIRALILPWQLLIVSSLLAAGYLTGLGFRVWLVVLGMLCGAACHAWWQRHRGAGALDLPAIRRTTTLSAVVFGVGCGIASAAMSDMALTERAIAAVGTLLVTAFATGVLTLCGLSLGLGAAQPTTQVLPDPAHPDRPRRPT